MAEGQFRWLPSLRDLDEDQLSVIHSSLNKEGNLIYGPAGCGKTAIILYCAKTLQDTGKNFIVFVYTKALIKFIESALDDLGIPRQNIARLYQWVRNRHLELIGEAEECDDEEKMYSKWVDNVINAFQKQPNKIPRYDFILVDEAQDFKPNVAKLLHMMSDNIFIAGDTAQSIYRDMKKFEEFTGIWQPIKNNFRLLYNYRNPRTVANLAALFLNSSPLTREEFLKIIKGREFEMKPVLFIVEDQNEQVEKIVKIIQESRGSERIAILCLYRRLARNLQLELAKRNINVETTIDGDNYNFNNPRPVVTTVHSSKGLEFDCVIIPELNLDVWDEGYFSDKKEQLLFVGMTRTKNRLYLIAQRGKESHLIKRILETDPNLIQMPRNILRNRQSSDTFDDLPF